MNSFEYRKYFEETYVKTPFFGVLSRERTLQECDDLIKLCRFKPEELTLDLGCGQGRHSLEIARSGFTIIGLDFSRTMLRIAKKNSDRMYNTARFILADMAALPFQYGSFDRIISLFGSFGYHDDEINDRILGSIFDTLKTGGMFLLDIWNRSFNIKFDGQEKKFDLDDGTIMIQRYEYLPESSRMTMIREFNSSDKSEIFKVAYRLYTPEEIEESLIDAGFTNIRFYGDYQGNPLAKKSRGMVIQCNKP